jgi:hypothetical protein
MSDDLDLIDTQMARLAPTIIRTASMSESAAEYGFDVGVHDSIKEFVVKFVKEFELTNGVEPSVLAECARLIKSSLWRHVFIELEEIRENQEKQQRLMLPADFWKEKAEAIGKDYGQKIAMRGQMSVKSGRKIERDLHAEVKALAQRLTGSWPLSPKTQKAVGNLLQDAAVGAAMAFLDRVDPASHHGCGHA